MRYILLGAFFLFTLDVAAQRKDSLVTDHKALNFLLIGDWGRNGADHQIQVARQMGKTASKASVDFIVSAGDNFYPLGVASEHDPLWKYSFEDIYTDFSLQWNWYPVLGNHDYGANPEAQVKYSAISRRWEMPSRYYSKMFHLNGDSTKQLLMIFIDTTPLIPGYYAGDGHKVHDQDSTAQKRWLERQLASASENVKWKFVVGHHPMYTGGGRSETHDTKAMRRILQPLLEKYKVDAYVAGHEHSLQHIVTSNGIDQFISGSSSERTPVRKLPVSRFAASEYGFMLFSVYPTRALVQVVDVSGSVIYKTEIAK